MFKLIFRNFHSAKKIFNSEIFRFVFLILATLYAYQAFLYGKNMGATDAKWYQYLLHDAIIQFQHGFFPPIVGQSEFNYIGASYIRAPYYLILGVFLHILTCGKLNTLYLQHLTVIVTALAAALIGYHCFKKTIQKSPWIACMIAFLYVTCPGIMGLIFNMDMYNSFMAIPFVPLTFYGLIRQHEKDDVLSYIFITMGLSLTWMAHPPIALWLGFFVITFITLEIISLKKIPRKLWIIPSLFLLLNCWQFIGVFSFKLNKLNEYSLGPHFVEHLISILKSDLPDNLLPLRRKTENTAFLQLGYSLWLLLLSAFFLGCSRFKNILVRNLFFVIFLIILLLYPIPKITALLWSLIPNNFYDVTNWPMQRLYLILATAVAFASALVLKNALKPTQVKYVYLFFLIALCWNCVEIQYFIKKGRHLHGRNTSWESSDNISLMPFGLLPNHFILGGFKTFDPALKNSLLDHQFHALPLYDNEKYLATKCAQKSFSLPQGFSFNDTFPFKVMSDQLKPIITLTGHSDQHLALCIDALVDNSRLLIEIQNPNHRYAIDNYIDPTITRGFTSIQLTTPLFDPPHQKDELNDLNFILYFARVDLGLHKETPIIIKSFSLVNYDKKELPIKLSALTPYQATVLTSTPNNYLYVFKEYFPGYQARINGKEINVIASHDNMLLIPIPEKGLNHIELSFQGSSLLHHAFWVSVGSWFILLSYLFLRGSRKYSEPKINYTL